jgi:hypothetical protein
LGHLSGLSNELFEHKLFPLAAQPSFHRALLVADMVNSEAFEGSLKIHENVSLFFAPFQSSSPFAHFLFFIEDLLHSLLPEVTNFHLVIFLRCQLAAHRTIYFTESPLKDQLTPMKVLEYSQNYLSFF